MLTPRQLFFILLFLGMTGFSARAEVYSFVDEEGVVHYTNVPTDSRYKRLDSDLKPAKNKSTGKPKASKAAPARPYHPAKVTAYDEYIREASQRFNIPEPLIRAVMAAESAFNPKAVSPAGAQGLMQLMPGTAGEMGVDDPFDPRQSILGGTRYLRFLANAFDGNMVLTLAGYNAGHQAVFRHMDIPPFAETQTYVRRVLELYYHYKREAQAPAAPEGRKPQ
jgi:soluble lytic murein transglycosylase-like protein